MFDPNILAILIPVDTQDLARNSFALDANAHCYHNPANAIAEEPANWSRETTPAPQRSAERTYDSVVHIVIKFSNKPKDPSRGWLLGTDPRRADVLLRGTKKGVSRHHLYVTVNERLYAEAHDNSTFGAAVGYDGKAKDEARKKDRWILSLEPGRRRKWNDIIIYLPNEDGLAFRIEFPNHEAGHPEYVANLQAFLHESRAALPPVGALGLNSIPATVAPSQTHTPRYGPIFLDDGIIGRGAFGEVRKMIETRTGDVYAAKKIPQTKPDPKQQQEEEAG